jgi:hypothetical protein
VFSELFHTKSQGVFEVRAPVWNGVADARFGIFVFCVKKWRRRDESNTRSCRIGNVEGTGQPWLNRKNRSGELDHNL